MRTIVITNSAAQVASAREARQSATRVMASPDMITPAYSAWARKECTVALRRRLFPVHPDGAEDACQRDRDSRDEQHRHAPAHLLRRHEADDPSAPTAQARTQPRCAVRPPLSSAVRRRAARLRPRAERARRER